MSRAATVPQPPPTASHPPHNSRCCQRRKRRRRCLPGCGSWARVQLLSSYAPHLYKTMRILETWRRQEGHVLTEAIGPRRTRRDTEIRRWRRSPRTRILQRRLRAKDDTERSCADTRDAVRLPSPHFFAPHAANIPQRTRRHERTPTEEAPLAHAAEPPRSRREPISRDQGQRSKRDVGEGDKIGGKRVMCIPGLVLYYDRILGMKHGVGLNMISL
jgi:hypothetical protein